MEPIIEVNNISKKYNIYANRGGYIALRDVLTNALKNPFKFAKEKTKSMMQSKEEFWALKDINFSVNRGETIGIIGANGAGKSTLLKILSQITPPTTGEIKIKGRVASLLEVGTGFNPELTGRENIYISGAILGMKKEEINKKFDEIVEFAGIEKFIDTPAKRYSSGMTVRLGFAVAAHLDPEILLVDEVLAVGDAEFQKKCLGKMDEVTKQEGRTILFISHNMGAIRNLCQKSILLDHGQIISAGKTEIVLNEYANTNTLREADIEIKEQDNKIMNFRKIRILNNRHETTTNLDTCQPFHIEIEFEIHDDVKSPNHLGILFFDYSPDYPILNVFDVDTNEKLYNLRLKGRYKAIFNFPPNIFNWQNIKILPYFNIRPGFGKVAEEISLTFIDTSSFATKFFRGKRGGKFLLKIPCDITSIK